MKQKNSFAEKRLHTRVNTDLPIIIKTSDTRIKVIGTNLCCTGIHCDSYVHFPCNTKVQLSFKLPNKQNEFEYLMFNGVVIRVKEACLNLKERKIYKIAIYFENLLPFESNILKQYLNEEVSDT
ncbi:MAG: hypothetical protein FJ264_00085 [Planctomycetes bacterium]|nr:hypothetical protein [Planctomycetota bacterium]